MNTMTRHSKGWLSGLIVCGLLVVLGGALWQRHLATVASTGLASGNGRIEAVEIDVAAKTAGRVEEILVREGEFVTAGQLLARLDSATLVAQLRQAEAQLQQAESSVATTRSQLRQRDSETAAALALVRQRDTEVVKARQHAQRSAELVKDGAIARQTVDDDLAQLQIAEAAATSARAQVAASEATSMAVRTQIDGAEAAVAAAQANIARIAAELRDCALTAPRAGRVQYRVAQPGEVVAAGGRVLSLVDLSDVYMTFFLPTAAAGQVAIGSEVRLVLDAAPQYVLPARVSFIADVAQFTPKTVETASEREKLMFRLRAQLPVELLNKHIAHVKTGLPGMAYVRLDPSQPWPARLQVKLPP